MLSELALRALRETIDDLKEALVTGHPEEAEEAGEILRQMVEELRDTDDE